MDIAILCIAAAAIGVELGLRFKVLVLFPAIVLANLLVAGFELRVGASRWEIILWVALATVALQIGYFGGLVLRKPMRSPSTTLVVIAAASLLFPLNAFAFSDITTGEPALAPIGFARFCAEAPARCEPTSLQTVNVKAAVWKELRFVNTAVNRTITPKLDRSITRPWRDSATHGDCRDYALAKRSQLIDRGFPASALVIANRESSERRDSRGSDRRDRPRRSRPGQSPIRDCALADVHLSVGAEAFLSMGVANDHDAGESALLATYHLVAPGHSRSHLLCRLPHGVDVNVLGPRPPRARSKAVAEAYCIASAHERHEQN
jgi:predicted transglutaminase-like cysteine proteinase